MDHEGTPITFKIERIRRDRTNYDTRLSDHTPNLGVFVTSVKIKGEVEKAKVWSPRDASVHTVPFHTVLDFHDKPINLDSMVVHDWQALVKTMPTSMLVNEAFVLHQMTKIELRSKIAILATKPPSEWPVTSYFDKDGDEIYDHLEEITKDWPLNRCYLNMGADYEVRYERVVLNIINDPLIRVQAVALRRGRRRKEDEHWILYDPALGTCPWQAETVDRIGKMMRAYEAMKNLGSINK